MRLLDYAHDTYSQTGEDGVLAKALELLGENDRWCVEFGAWDGQHLSNTFNLVQNKGYSAVLIEGHSRRFRTLAKRFEGNPKVTAVNAYVGFSAEDGLDKILSRTSIPSNFDLLSIDIDGNDYHTWHAVSAYVPKLVCIEYNPTIPPEVDFVQPADPGVSQGASLRALVRLGVEKGYSLIAVTPLNAILVRSEYFPAFGIADNSVAALWENRWAVTQVFSGYDGTIFFAGHQQLPWHAIQCSGRIRQLPPLFRRNPLYFGAFSSFIFRAYRKFLRLTGRG